MTITSKKGTNAKMVFTIGPGSLVLCVPESALNCNPDIVDPIMSFGITANGTPVGNVAIDRNGSHGPFFNPLTGQLTTSAIPIGPIDLAAAINAQVGLVGLSGLSNPFTTAGTVDFAHTATLRDIEVFDATGNPVSDFTVYSLSGTRYPLSTPVGPPVIPPAVGVPEPGTAALLFCGVTSLAAIRRAATRKGFDRGRMSSMQRMCHHSATRPAPESRA